MRKWKGMEDSKSKRYAHDVMTMRWRAQVKLQPSDVVCDSWMCWRNSNKTERTKILHTCWCQAEFHVLRMEVGLDLGCHVVIGVVLGFTTQTQYQIQSSFHLNFVVQLWTCSQTVLCDRQFICGQIIAHFSIEKPGHLPSVTVDRRQLCTTNLYQSNWIRENHALEKCSKYLCNKSPCSVSSWFISIVTFIRAKSPTWTLPTPPWRRRRRTLCPLLISARVRAKLFFSMATR